jgi:hypothetical protein
MGGFHLLNTKPQIIHSTVADIKEMKPDYIMSCRPIVPDSRLLWISAERCPTNSFYELKMDEEVLKKGCVICHSCVLGN